MNKVIEKSETKTSALCDDNIIRYAWGNSSLKTWFITKDKKGFIPKGSKLLFIITGKITNAPIFTSDSYPIQGDIVTDINGINIKIDKIDWI